MQMQRVVIKLGTSVLTAGSDRLNRPLLVALARQVAELRRQQIQVLIVSSGAIAAGKEVLGVVPLQRSRANVPVRQMFAAAGQSRLMHLYDQLFEIYGLQVAQALLTREDLIDRKRYLNARNTLNLCLEHNLVPIVNENDAVATSEIRVGDNDNLSAYVAGLIDADLLLILTDIPGLYDADPRANPDARLIEVVDHIDDRIRAMAGGSGTHRGTGGMRTKIEAAERATRTGTTVVVASGSIPDVILRIVAQEPIGTRFTGSANRLDSRKRWITAEIVQSSRLVVDAGAAHALLHQGRSLLPAGIIQVEGSFDRGQTVRIFDTGGHEIACGLTQYRSADVDRIRGLHSHQIDETLGYDYGPEVVHRDDMIMSN